MKHLKTWILGLFAVAICGQASAQDVARSGVPTPILKAFNQQFPKASDIEWEMTGNIYKVEFEIGWKTDHEVWYDQTGKVVKHQEEIPVDQLPKNVQNMIKADYSKHSINDLEKITENGKVTYKMELNSLLHQDWTIVTDADGKVISKLADD